MKRATILALALLAGITQSAELKSFVPASNMVVSGDSIHVFVVLDTAAPAGGEVVTISESSSVLSAPSSVTVPQHQAFAAVPVQTYPVSSAATRTVTATLRTVSRTAHLNLVPYPALDRMELDHTEMYGGETATGRVFLSGPAPAAGVAVNLSDDSSALEVETAMLVIPGSERFGTYSLRSSQVSATSIRSVSATWAGAKRTVSVTLHPMPLISSVWLTSNVVADPGETGPGETRLHVSFSGSIPASLLPEVSWSPDVNLMLDEQQVWKNHFSARIKSAHYWSGPTIVTVQVKLGSQVRSVTFLRV